MFKAKWTSRATAEYQELMRAAASARETRRREGRSKTSRPEGLFKQIDKTIRLLLANPRHPGLRSHEFTSMRSPYDPLARVFEAYAQNDTSGAYRIFWCYGPAKGEITILAITPHP